MISLVLVGAIVVIVILGYVTLYGDNGDDFLD